MASVAASAGGAGLLGEVACHDMSERVRFIVEASDRNWPMCVLRLGENSTSRGIIEPPAVSSSDNDASSWSWAPCWPAAKPVMVALKSGRMDMAKGSC